MLANTNNLALVACETHTQVMTFLARENTTYSFLEGFNDVYHRAS